MSEYIIKLIYSEPLKKLKKNSLSPLTNSPRQDYYISDIVPVFMGKIAELLTLSYDVEEARRFDRLADAQHYVYRCDSIGREQGIHLGLVISEIISEELKNEELEN